MCVGHEPYIITWTTNGMVTFFFYICKKIYVYSMFEVKKGTQLDVFKY